MAKINTLHVLLVYLVGILLVGVLVGVIATRSVMTVDKRICEEPLARNVECECVWVAPEAMKDE